MVPAQKADLEIVRGGSLPQARFLLHLHKDFHPSPHKALAEGLPFSETKILKRVGPVLQFGAGYSPRQTGGGSAFTRRVREHVEVSQWETAYELEGRVEMVFRFAGKPHEDVSSKCCLREEVMQLANNLRVFPRSVRAMHALENFFIAAL